MVFKKYPSCGVTQGVTELTLRLMARHGVAAADVASAQVRLPPYAHRLVGHAFRPGGANPRVDAQFSAAYCVANALHRGASRLAHFAPPAVADAAVQALAARVQVLADAALDARGHTAVDLQLRLQDGRCLQDGLDLAPGFPGAGLDEDQHRARLDDCLAYAPFPPGAAQRQDLLAVLDGLDALDDVRRLLPLLVTETAPGT